MNWINSIWTRLILGNGIFITLFILSVTSVFATEKIYYMPIQFDAKRVELTRQYQLQHYGIHSQSIEIKPRMIVIHCTQSNGFESGFNYLYPSQLAKGRAEIENAGELNVSAQFMVDRNGDIYQLMPDNWMARHVIGLNPIAIGIENVGCYKKTDDMTPEQLQANKVLVQHLVAKYPTIKYLIGHFEYLIYRDSALWREKDRRYCTVKFDPGPNFMANLRHEVAELGLSPRNAPQIIPRCRH